jgi:hypothetical protein
MMSVPPGVCRQISDLRRGPPRGLTIPVKPNRHLSIGKILPAAVEPTNLRNRDISATKELIRDVVECLFGWHIFCSMQEGMKPALLAALCLSLSSCAAATFSSPEVYRIGEIEVRLYKNRETLAQELPPLLSTLEALRVSGKQVQVLGYFDRQKKRIYSIDDPRVLLHELKHYLEPDWRHDIECTRPTTPHEQVGSPCEQRALAESTRTTPQSVDRSTDPPMESRVKENRRLGS